MSKSLTSKEKAVELVSKFQGLAYPYIGSSMLTNTAYGESILQNAKESANIVLDEIHLEWMEQSDDYSNDCREWWNNVRVEVGKLTCEDIGIKEGYIR